MIHVISHAKCFDGLAAAYAAWKQLGSLATYNYLSYGDLMPEIEDGTKVYILDYSRPFDELMGLVDRSCSVTLLDHHETALVEALKHTLAVEKLSDDDIEDLIDEKPIRCVSGIDRGLTIHLYTLESGAILAWKRFSPTHVVPEALRYIDDRDRWVWRLPNSEAVSEGLGQALQEFRANLTLEQQIDSQTKAIAEFQWLDTLASDPNYVAKMVAKGTPLVEPRRQAVREMCEDVQWVEIGGYQVPIVYAPNCHSWVGHELCQRFPEAKFSATWREMGEGSAIDLRSNNGFRVNRVARQYGGGGHPAAAGFRVTNAKLEQWLEEKKDVNIE